MRSLKLFRILFIAVTLFVGRSVFAQSAIYLDVPGIAGDSTASGHLKQMVATSFAFGCSNTNGTARFQEITITKYVDRASPLLFLASAQGAMTNTATLYVQKLVNSTATDFYVIKLTNARISSVTDYASLGDSQPSESVTLQYQKIEIDYTPFNNGQPQPPIVMTWDVATNQPN